MTNPLIPIAWLRAWRLTKESATMSALSDLQSSVGNLTGAVSKLVASKTNEDAVLKNIQDQLVRQEAQIADLQSQLAAAQAVAVGTPDHELASITATIDATLASIPV